VKKHTILTTEQADEVNTRAAELHTLVYNEARKTMDHDAAFRAASQAVERWRLQEVARRLTALNGGAL
jgi:uncharacterized coiled-coil DUF342 family protein